MLIGKRWCGLISRAAPARRCRCRTLIDHATTPEYLIVLLIDERRSSHRHARSGVAIRPRSTTRAAPCRWRWSSKARLVEQEDVVILLDDHALTTLVPPSARSLRRSRLNALRSEAFLGAPQHRRGRTIMSTAPTTPRAHVSQQFSAPATEIHLDRKLVDKRVFPASTSSSRAPQGRAAPAKDSTHSVRKVLHCCRRRRWNYCSTRWVRRATLSSPAMKMLVYR